METNELITLVSNVGIPFTITIYFLVRDWKFNNTLVQTMTTLTDTVNTLKETIKMLHAGDV